MFNGSPCRAPATSPRWSALMTWRASWLTWPQAHRSIAGRYHQPRWASDMAKTIPHIVNRFVIDSERTFDDVRLSYESLVPTIDFTELAEVIATGDLSRVQQYTAEHAPHSFVNFWTLDPMPMMHLAGNQQRAITYMMGNNVIAETMFRHDPGIILYAPLRTAIYEDGLG